MEICKTENAVLPQILLLTHGYMGAEMIKSAEIIVGDIDGVLFIPLTAETDLNEYRDKVRSTIADLNEGSIILADLFGGTPCNTAAILSREYTAHTIAGINLSVLIESVQLRTKFSGKELCEKILEYSKGSIQFIPSKT